MKESGKSRREFIKTVGLVTGAELLTKEEALGQAQMPVASTESTSADHMLRIKTSPIELAPNRIVSATTYNGQFPGPLLRLKEGQQVTVDVYNDTDTPEQLHWHGQMVRADVDGAAEEGTPFVPAHGKRRIVFTPRPWPLRIYVQRLRGSS